MTMEQTPDERPEGSQQQATPPEGFIELARYNGLVRKVDEMVRAQKDRDLKIEGLSGELEKYKADIVEKDATSRLAVSERDKRLEETVTEKSKMEAELRRLKALEAKVEVANEIGHPELLAEIKTLPDFENREALKTIFEEIANFADKKAKQREDQLMAGVTFQSSGVKTNSANNSPTTEAEWKSAMSKLEIGTPEYQKALDDFWNFQMQQQK